MLRHEIGCGRGNASYWRGRPLPSGRLRLWPLQFGCSGLPVAPATCGLRAHGRAVRPRARRLAGESLAGACHRRASALPCCQPVGR